MSSFTITLSAYDSRNHRHLFFKADGQRFGDARTIKLSCDVKYDLTVTIKPWLRVSSAHTQPSLLECLSALGVIACTYNE